MQRSTATILGVVAAAVVAGLLLLVLIASVAVPRLTDARRKAYEEAAVRNLNVLNGAQVSYFSLNGRYARTLNELASLKPEPGVPELPTELLSGEASGYAYTLRAGPTGYAIQADPLSQVTGTLHFYTDASTVIRVNPDGPAGETDPAIR